MVIVYVLMVVIGAAGAIFALQNIEPGVIRFLAWRIEGAPLALVIMMSIMIGVVFASLVGIVQQLRLKSRIRHLEHQLAKVPAAAEREGAGQSPQ